MGRHSAPERIRSTARRALALAVSSTLVVSAAVAAVFVGGVAASADPLPAPAASIALRETGAAEADPKGFILAGEDAIFDVSLSNTSATEGGYNIAFTLSLPNGIDFVESAMGSPVVYASGDTLPNSALTPPLPTVPAGMQLWVFEDVADLPATADYRSSVTVRPDAGVFPVGSTPAVALTGYVSSDATLRPMFDGSTGVGGSSALAETSSSSDGTEIPIRAVRLTKSEPSPEIELLRGVHDNQTVYTLTIEHTPQGDTTGVTVVDFLPAGLEFLGCGAVDNTLESPVLFDGGTAEYPGAGSITGTAPADCVQPISVETVDTGIPADLPAGVYTKVTWALSDLTGGTPQAFPAAAGTPGVIEIRYLAAVPLFENTMEFVTVDGAITPTPGSLEQASNLNNNTGASTRQGQAAGFNDGILYTNSATVSGVYAGAVVPSTPDAASDSDTERIQAMDLRILKGVETGAGDEFITGALATFTLDLATSEYASADEITLVDVIPNGLCPALPVDVPTSGDPFPSDCAFPVSAGTPILEGAEVLSIAYDGSTGEFAMTFVPDVATIAADGELQIRYTALMRAFYETHDQWTGNTSSGDSLVNVVDLEGFTHSIPALDGVTNGAGVEAFGDVDVFDDSSAEIVSGFSGISKRVLDRDAVNAATPATAETSCDVAPASGLWSDTLDAAGDTPFHQGDVVCYELTIDFASQIDVRNPKLTDFLPAGVRYLSSAVYTGPGGTTGGVTIEPAVVDGQRIDWEIGTVGTDGDRFVPLGSKLVVHVLGELTTMTPNGAEALDKPENLMKYQQENVLDEVFFLRDASAIQAGTGPSLLKGVESVDGDTTRPANSQNPDVTPVGDGSVFDSNRDGIQVVRDDLVTFRVDLTGGDTDVVDMVVWDALPPGITSADVDGISDGGTVVDFGELGYPSDLAASPRSVVIWNGLDLAAGAQRTLTYDVEISSDVLVGISYVNTASIVAFDVELNSGSTETFYPDGSLDTAAHPIDSIVPGEGMRDDSDVFTPIASVAKSLVETEVSPVTNNLDPNNGAAQAVQGELITWQYSVTVPANTSVAGAVLRDRGTLTSGTVPFTVTDGSWSASALTGATTADFDFTANPGSGSFKGVLEFPSLYTNSSSVPQTFTVVLTGYLADAGNNNTTLTNQAQFNSDSWDGTATAQVVYREPNLAIQKSASPSTDVAVGDPVTYTLSVTNNSNRVKSYDNVIVDTVPVGLIVDTDSFSPAPTAFEPGIETGLGGTITWNVAEIPATATLTYIAEISPLTGAGSSYVNEATVTGYTLPSTVGGESTTDRRGTRTSDDDATIQAITADIDKGVRIAGDATAFAGAVDAPIGETVEYEVVATLYSNINYYDPRIVDDMPAGVELIEATITGPTSSSATIAGTWTRSYDAPTNTWTWAYDGDIASVDAERTLTLRYEVLLSDAVAANVNDLDNTARFTWNGVDDDESTRTSVTDDADVDVLNPVLAIDKAVSNAAPNPGDEFDYTVTLRNTGNTPAFNLVVTDDVPVGVIVDASTISAGGVLTGAGPNGGGTITWDATDLPGPLHEQASSATPKTISLTYSATLAASGTIGDAETFTNTASVDHFESFPTGGREYDPTTVIDTATVDPAFPNVTLEKTTTAGDVAYAETPFGWTLTLVNTGDGPAQTIAVSDVLPENWEYDTGSAMISVGGATAVALADPTITAAGDVQSLQWSPTQISSTTPALPGTGTGATATQRTIVVTFTATPTLDALTDAGVTTSAGVRVPHTNTLSAVTTDTSDATENESGPYTGPDADADAFIHAADLELVKVASAGLVAGAGAGTAWTITVTNTGPDTAVGPFLVTDEWGDAGVLPDGFTVTGFAGTGWTCAAVATTGFECERTNTADTLTDGAAFPPIVVTAQAAAGFDPADSPIDNSATVSSEGTFDPNEDNDTDADEVPVTVSADLSIVKTGPSTAPNAGGSISWSLTVANAGPSDSVSAAGDLITVTDTIPDGVSGVQLGTLPTGWTASAPGPFAAGDTVTLTLDAGLRLTPSQSVAVTLTGTVDADHVPGESIANTAEVEPGVTPDPDPDNNESTTTTTPTTDTTLGVTKTRQVLDGGVWRDATSDDEVVPGTTVTYLVTVANTGTADARTVSTVDEVPAYLAYTGIESVVGTWSRTSTTAAPGDDQSFSLAEVLVPGTSAAFRVTLSIDPDYAEPVVNWVQADAENSTNEPRDSDDSDSTRSANLSIVKAHSGDAVAGSTLDYTLTVTNEGPSASSGPIVVADTLPVGFGYAADSAEISVEGAPSIAVEPSIAGQVLTWTVGDGITSLPVGATIVVTFTSTIDSGVLPGGYDNVGTVDGPDDTDPSDDSWTDPTEVTASADLSITKDAADGPYIAGTQVEYTLTVTNAGPSVARDVSVVDSLPAGMTLVSMSGADWDCVTEPGQCDRADLPLGTSTITVTALIASTVTDGSDLTNIATVDSSTPDPTPPTPAEETITVDAEADLRLIKTAVDAAGAPITTAAAGTELHYELVVDNLGASDAVGPLTIEDTLPAGLSYVAVSGGTAAWTCEVDVVDAQLVICTNPSGLAAGTAAETLVIVAGIDPALPVGAVTNTAVVGSPTTDPVPSNNTDDAEVSIEQSSDLSIVKTHDADAVRIGDELAFDLAVRNAGPSTATGITVVDTLPAGLEFVGDGDTDSAWTVTAEPMAEDGTTTVTATLEPALGPDTAAPLLQIVVLVHPEAYAEVVNVAVVSGDQPEPTPADNTSEDPVEVPPMSTLVVEKTSVGTFQVGSEGVYEITVRNDGPTEDPGPVVVTDELPAGLMFVAADGDGTECAALGGVVTCTVDEAIAVDATVTITLTVAVWHGAYPEVVNTAVVTTPTEQTPDASLTSTVTTPVEAQPLSSTGGSLPWAVLTIVLLVILGGSMMVGRRGLASGRHTA